MQYPTSEDVGQLRLVLGISDGLDRSLLDRHSGTRFRKVHLVAICPECGREGRHDWSLDGVFKTQRVRCFGCDAEFLLRPVKYGEAGWSRHKLNPWHAMRRLRFVNGRPCF